MADMIEKETLVYEVYKKRISKYGKKEEWILIFKKQLKRIKIESIPHLKG